MEKILSNQFIDPETIVKNLDLKNGDQVADFGCGSGFFSIPFARAVSDAGVVWSLDILSSALEAVESQAKTLGLLNIKTRRANVEKINGSNLKEDSMDWVIMKDILFQNKNKEDIIREAYRVLKPEGKALIMEWNNKNFMVGPPKEKRVSQQEIFNMLDKNKFIIKKIFPAGDFHYVIIAEK